MSDDEFDQICKDYAIWCRKKVIKTLLSGNDSQCFTTQQYVDTYIKVINKGGKSIMDYALGRRHLEKLSEYVKEVSQDIWVNN